MPWVDSIHRADHTSGPRGCPFQPGGNAPITLVWACWMVTVGLAWSIRRARHGARSDRPPIGGRSSHRRRLSPRPMGFQPPRRSRSLSGPRRATLESLPGWHGNAAHVRVEVADAAAQAEEVERQEGVLAPPHSPPNRGRPSCLIGPLGKPKASRGSTTEPDLTEPPALDHTSCRGLARCGTSRPRRCGTRPRGGPGPPPLLG